MDYATLGKRPHVQAAAWMHKRTGDVWKRFYFVLTPTSLFYYSHHRDPSTLVGYLDRAQVSGVQTTPCSPGEWGRVDMVTFRISVADRPPLDLATTDPQVKTIFCRELSETSDAIVMGRGRGGGGSKGPADGAAEGTAPGARALTSALSSYESEFDQMLDVQHNSRSQRLEQSLMDMLGDQSGATVAMKTVSRPSANLDELLALLDDMVACGETPLIQQTVRRVIQTRVAATHQLAPACAAHLRNTFVATVSAARMRRNPGSVMELWNDGVAPPDSDTLLIDSDQYDTIMGALMQTAADESLE